MLFNHPKSILLFPSPWKNCLPQNWPLVPKMVGDHWFKVSLARVTSSWRALLKALCCKMSHVRYIRTNSSETLGLRRLTDYTFRRGQGGLVLCFVLFLYKSFPSVNPTNLAMKDTGWLFWMMTPEIPSYILEAWLSPWTLWQYTFSSILKQMP